jgi:hypothetical protein
MHAAEQDSRELRLREWQSVLQGCIVEPRRDRAPLFTWLRCGAVDADIRLDVYANAYVLRLIEALRSNYPALHQVLGDDDFALMARRYLEHYPSVHPSIRWFGDSMQTFLQQHDPYCRLPVLAELATFEWAIRHTIDAADAERLSVEGLLSVPVDAWSELRFDLHPSVTLLALEWNAPQLWKSLADDADPACRDAIAPLQQTLHWLVWRKPDQVSGWRSLPDVEQLALRRLQQGATFADICECIALQDDCDVAMQAAGLLRAWVEQGILVYRKPGGT